VVRKRSSRPGGTRGRLLPGTRALPRTITGDLLLSALGRRRRRLPNGRATLSVSRPRLGRIPRCADQRKRGCAEEGRATAGPRAMAAFWCQVTPVRSSVAAESEREHLTFVAPQDGEARWQLTTFLEDSADCNRPTVALTKRFVVVGSARIDNRPDFPDLTR